MSKKLTYADLPDEDKLLMNDLFERKKETKKSRQTVRNMISRLRSLEMKMTEEIMNLSTRKISEKFDLCASAAKPLTKRNLENIKNRLSLKEASKHNTPARQQRIMKEIQKRNEKATCSENGRKPETHYKGTSKNSWCYG